MLERQSPRQLFSLLAQSADAAADAKRPVDEPAPESRGGVQLGRDRGVRLLVEAGHTGQQRGAHLRQDLSEGVRIGAERDREPGVSAPERHQPPEVVRERQVEQHHVLV